MDLLIPTLSVLAMSSPIMVVWVTGAALAISRWRRHPRVSQFALIACGMMIVNTVVNTFVRVWLPLGMRDRGWTSAQIGSISISIGIVTALIGAVAWALVICAIFGWRNGTQKQDLFPPASPTFGGEPREQNTMS